MVFDDIGLMCSDQVLGNTMAHSMWLELQLINNRLGSLGAANVCKGLAFNSSLRQLALQVRTYVMEVMIEIRSSCF